MEPVNEYLLVDDYNHVLPNLVYSPTTVPGVGADMNEFESQLFGCNCSVGADCVLTSSCQATHICKQNYSSDKLLLEEKWGTAGVVECNCQCTCSVTNCSNRVVQNGPRKGLEIVMAGPEKGYGLITQEFIPKGAFICEYAGELIGLEEAKSRFKSAHTNGKMNYIFVLREIIGFSDDAHIIETIIDPSYIGNIGRYINHSCDPNSGIVPVRIDSPVPKLGIFSKCNILPGAEITYDYSGGLGAPNRSNVTNYDKKPCFCGSQICKGSLPFDVSLL